MAEEKEIIEIEANTLEEAREQARSQIPEGYYFHSEQLDFYDPEPKIVKVTAETVEAAFEKTQRGIPNNAYILERKELVIPEIRVVKVEAFGSEAAISKMKTSQSGRDVLVKDVKLAIPGKKGFLGIGKKPDLYEVEILLLAAVEIIYRTKVKISVKIGKNSIGVGQLDWVLDYMPIISSGTYPKSTQEMSRKQILEWQEKQGFRTIGAFSWAGFQFGYKSGNETVRITERGGGLETDYIIARTGIKSWAIVDETGRYTD